MLFLYLFYVLTYTYKSRIGLLDYKKVLKNGVSNKIKYQTFIEGKQEPALNIKQMPVPLVRHKDVIFTRPMINADSKSK